MIKKICLYLLIGVPTLIVISIVLVPLIWFFINNIEVLTGVIFILCCILMSGILGWVILDTIKNKGYK